MDASISAVEKILNYTFKNKRLLEEALTHPSHTDSDSDSDSGSSFNYQRLEFLGDAALALALSNHAFLAYPGLDPGHLSLFRAANVSTERLARVALRHRLFHFLRHNSPALHLKVMEFEKVVEQEDVGGADPAAYGGTLKAPKVLADIVEAVAAAVYLDVDLDLQRLWVIFRGLLEPIITVEDLQKQPQPVTMLFQLCRKQGKHVDIKFWRKEEKTIASVFVDAKFVVSGSSEDKETAKLNAAKGALKKLSECVPATSGLLYDSMESSFEVEGAKQKLLEICGKQKWPNPCYSIENETGSSHEKRYVCSVKIAAADGVLYMTGDEKTRVKAAENSAASLVIRALKESGYL